MIQEDKNYSIDEVVEVYELIGRSSYDIICDVERKFKFVGDRLLHLLQLTKEQAIGHVLQDFDSPVKALAERYRTLNDAIISGTTDEREYLTVLNYQDEFILLHTKAQAIKINKQIIGVYFKNQVIDPLSSIGAAVTFDLINSGGLLTSSNGAVFDLTHNEPQEFSLTDTQELILFLLLLGKADIDIITIVNKLNNSDYTQQYISKIIARNLFKTFNVTNRRQLVEKAFEANAIRRIPKLLSKNINYLLGNNS